LILDLESGETETETLQVLLEASFGILFELLAFGWPFMLPSLKIKRGEAETRYLEVCQRRFTYFCGYF